MRREEPAIEGPARPVGCHLEALGRARRCQESAQRRQSSACQASSGPTWSTVPEHGRRGPSLEAGALQPLHDHPRPVHGIAVVKVGDVAHGGEPPRSPRRRGAGGSPQVVGQRAQEGLVHVLVHQLEQRPDGVLGSPGVVPGAPPLNPQAAAVAVHNSVAGKGKSMLAQTPSEAPARAPRRSESRCDNQRSTPRVGTATTSLAKGSSNGSTSTSPRASTSWSARADRWR